MASGIVPNGLHWQRRAAEFRQLAATVDSPDAKESFLRIVEQYERLAISFEESEGGNSKPLVTAPAGTLYALEAALWPDAQSS